MSVKKPLFCNFQAISTKFGMKIHFHTLIKNISVSIRSDNKCPLKTVFSQFSSNVNEIWYVDTFPHADQEYVNFN